MDADDDEKRRAEALDQLNRPGRELADFLERAALDDPDRQERDATLSLVQHWFDPAEEDSPQLLEQMRDRAVGRYGWS